MDRPARSWTLSWCDVSCKALIVIDTLIFVSVCMKESFIEQGKGIKKPEECTALNHRVVV